MPTVSILDSTLIISEIPSPSKSPEKKFSLLRFSLNAVSKVQLLPLSWNSAGTSHSKVVGGTVDVPVPASVTDVRCEKIASV